MVVSRKFDNFFKSLSTVAGYAYNIWSPRDVIDPYAYPVMRDFFPEELRRVEDWTKEGATHYEINRIVKEVAASDRNSDVIYDESVLSLLDYATKEVMTLFRGLKVQPWTLDQAVDQLNMDTSAGYGHPGKKKGEIIDEIRKEAHQIMYDAKDARPQTPKPTMCGTRGHLHLKSSTKRRVIYNVPAAQVANEAVYIGPIMEQIKTRTDLPYLTGKNVIPRLRRMNAETCYPRGTYSVEIDMDHMDKSATTPLMLRAFEVLESFIDFENWNGKPVGQAQQKRWKRHWEYTMYYFLHTPVMIPSGEVFFVDGTVISGSSFTQLIETIMSLIMMVFTLTMMGKSWMFLYAVGDDGKAIVNGRPDLDKMAEIYDHYFSMTLSVKKSRVVKAGVGIDQFLGYTFAWGYLTRPTQEWFNLMLHPENPVTTLEVSFSRLTAYMMLGGVNDKEFCTFYEAYQSCWPLENWDFTLTKDLKTKEMYGGANFISKKLLEYTKYDFMDALITFK